MRHTRSATALTLGLLLLHQTPAVAQAPPSNETLAPPGGAVEAELPPPPPPVHATTGDSAARPGPERAAPSMPAAEADVIGAPSGGRGEGDAPAADGEDEAPGALPEETAPTAPFEPSVHLFLGAARLGSGAGRTVYSGADSKASLELDHDIAPGAALHGGAVWLTGERLGFLATVGVAGSRAEAPGGTLQDGTQLQLNAEAWLRFGSPAVALVLAARAGAEFSFWSDGKTTPGFLVGALPGVMFRLSRTMDLRFALGIVGHVSGSDRAGRSMHWWQPTLDLGLLYRL